MAAKVSLPFGRPTPPPPPGVGRDGKPKAEAEGDPEKKSEKKRKMPNPVLLALLALAMAALGFQIVSWTGGREAKPALPAAAESGGVKAKEPNRVLTELLGAFGEQVVRVEPVITPVPSGRTDPFAPLVTASEEQEQPHDEAAGPQISREVLQLLFPKSSTEPAEPQVRQEPAASRDAAGGANTPGPSSEPSAAETAAAGEEKPPEIAPPGLVVTGIIYDESRAYAVVRIGGESRPVKVGDAIAPGVVVKSVGAESVLVEKEGKEFEFKLGGGRE